MNNKIIILLTICLIIVSSCAQLTETGKTLWGSSTRVLEDARVDAISKSYVCSFDECFDAVLSLARDEQSYEPVSNQKIFDVFMKDRIKAHIVVLGITGNIDTTEVGIFFSRDGHNAYGRGQPTLSTLAAKLYVISLTMK